jgi:trans-aconitate 2-methyltransferase
MSPASDWSPESYLKFGNERTQPSIDLVNRIRVDRQPETIVDIGCGPGNSSRVLNERWPNARLTGVDSSPKMIEKARSDYPQCEWILADAATFSSDTKFDIVFSNAAIQWIPDHEHLLARLCGLLSSEGILAVQVPQFKNMPLSQAIERATQQDRWKKQTAHCSDLFSYHTYGFYYDELSKHLRRIEMWETRYHHVLESQLAIIEWIRSTGLKPYLDSLDSDEERAAFEEAVLAEVKKDYPLQKDRKVLFPFIRLFFVGYARK